MVRRPLILGALAALSLACGTPPEQQEKDPNDQRVEIPEAPAPAEGFQFVMPETIIPAGEEKMICWVPDFVPDQDYQITHFNGLQGPSGHHVVPLVSSVPRQPGETFDCTQIEMMTSLSPLILPDLSKEGSAALPDGYAVKLPKGSKIVIQSHYVNASKSDITVRDVARFSLAPAGSNPTMVSYFIINQGDVVIPPNAEHSSTYDCKVPANLQILSVFGHMHEYGRHVKIEHTHGGTTDTLYEVNGWTVSDRDTPPITNYAPEQPLVLEQNDSVKLTCDWSNTSSKELRFPSEMCTSVMYYFPADETGIHICDQ